MPAPSASAAAQASPRRSIRFWNSFGTTSITAAETNPAASMSQCKESRARMHQTISPACWTQLKKGDQARRSICLTLVVSQEMYSPVSRLW